MSRTILTKVDGFTPVIDSVMRETSLTAAVVFGGMWRYCQMKNGVCQATLEKIAERVGLSRQAIIEHIKKLEETGYIEDMTPNLRNKPHTYRDTGKAGLYMGVSTVNVVDSENDYAVNVIDSAVNVIDSQSTRRVLEDSIKKESKKPSTMRAEIFKVYSSEIGLITPRISDAINDYLDDLRFEPSWIIDAIHLAADNNKRNWAYCAAILKRWAVEGKTALPIKKKYPKEEKSFAERVMEA
jgi:DnaD/phage-associated family protein